MSTVVTFLRRLPDSLLFKLAELQFNQNTEMHIPYLRKLLERQLISIGCQHCFAHMALMSATLLNAVTAEPPESGGPTGYLTLVDTCLLPWYFIAVY
jgi:hypothetical protein